MKRIKGLGLGWSSLVWSKKQIKKMLVGMIKVLMLVIDTLLVILILKGWKRPPFIPLLSDFSALANFGTVL